MTDGSETLAELVRALLSPLESARLDPWREQVNRRLLDATGGTLAVFHLPEPGSASSFATPGPDPHESYHQRTLRLGAAPGEDELVAERGPETAAVALRVPGPAGSPAVLAVFGPAGEEFAAGAAELMRAVAPALRTGVALRRGIGARRAALARAVDDLDQMLLLCDDAGRILHVNRPLVDALDRGDAAAALVRGRMEHLARSLAHAPPSVDVEDSETASLTREVATESGAYRLLATMLAGEEFGAGTGILVSAERQVDDRPAPAELVARFGLTPRQADTALLMASGRSNAEIAAHLGVSLFTVQKHVRGVLQAVGVRSRSGVRAALLRGAAGAGR